MRRVLAFLWHAGNAHSQAVFRRSPLQPRTVLYESFAGNGRLCNPEAIFRELLGSPDFADLRHIWVFNGTRPAEFARDGRVRLVRYRSRAYFRALATSGYLVNNATFPPEFAKRSGQIYLNTWHGTPLKRMGYDMPDGAFESANTLRNLVSADFLLSQNPFMTTQMYETAYKLRGIYQGTILEAGYPRVDRQFMTPEQRSEAVDLLRASGIDVRGRKIVLYAPTWKGPSFSSPEQNVPELLRTAAELQRLLGDDDYLVLLKAHQIISAQSALSGSNILVPNEIPTNVVLGSVDVLITDYSSIFFDFLATDRPILFYRPAVEASPFAARGEYFSSPELPGETVTTVQQLAESIAGVGTDTMRAKRAEWRTRFLPRDDGRAAGRVVDAVFRGIADASSEISRADGRRPSLLLHLGSMNTNGITSSALNLLRQIDHTALDVSVVFNRPSNAQQRANQRQIDPHVRQFHRTGRMIGTAFTQLRRRIDELGGRQGFHARSEAQRQMWDDEWLRCFGAAQFDRVVDFDGYGPYWATLLLHSPAARRSIWMHNEMASEMHRIIRGRERLKRSLGAVFSRYPDFDALVSVSPSLADVNRLRLAERYGIDPARFLSARNLIDAPRVVEAAQHPLDEVISGDPSKPAGSLGDLLRDPAVKTFITLGRFSFEKNQSRLLRAFARVHTQRPESRLLLVGYGPLRSHLEHLIEELQLTRSAFVIGPYQNPFPILAASDCFVLSSNYEGQPMVILEAALLRRPIVSVAFSTVSDALPESTIRIVDQTDDALAEGMLAFLRGEVPPQRLDADRYARDALREFIAVTSGLPG
jgi:CDP-glycerol glycerophosphotransferase (TagB/SpsB family)/glycosyltransferase involved in cell wall biosynthesis